ncbi:hypothetical protein [Chryseolinea sp. H1M3-3]|uniref:hypothetical protein n=1 Tax=Chryseolinea sp. H1M3-3 TaxID=3034144 RepID=UPI0023EB9350|nr:hypothetical protein [Chryseolinea sp. H1M3-3]
MKTIKLIASLAVILILHSCDKPDEVTPTKASATFTFSEKQKSTGGRISGTSVPAFILLSLEDINGKEIIKDKKLTLHTFGESYVTEAIELTPGDYKLTKFLVQDAANIVIYATPLEGADLESFVDDPLPINFSVSRNITTRLSPQVLTVNEDDRPESFGYVGFGFEIANVSLKCNVKIDIGGVHYENVDATLRVKGYDISNSVRWTKDYNFVGPEDNIIAIKNGFHHYSIELVDTWGVSAVVSDIPAQTIWEGRADGPQPHTYALVGSKAAKKLTSLITSREVNVPTGITYQPESRTFFVYKGDGRLDQIRYELFNAQTMQFEEFTTENFTYEGTRVSKIVGRQQGKYFKELNYTYGEQDKIVETNLNSGITTTLVVTNNEDTHNGSVAFTFSNGNSFRYDFNTSFNNIVSDQIIKAGQLCSKGIYAFDKQINPFRHLGYLDVQFRNWANNNKLTERVDHQACVFPTLIPVSYDYTYDSDGYPTKQITSYKSGFGDADPVSPYHSKAEFYYE